MKKGIQGNIVRILPTERLEKRLLVNGDGRHGDERGRFKTG